MSLANPQIVTIDAVAWYLNEISSNGQSKTYRDSTGKYEMIIGHNEGKRNRRTCRLNEYAVTADPFVPANNLEVSQSIYFVIDTPVAGFAAADTSLFAMGLRNFADTAIMDDLLAGKS